MTAQNLPSWQWDPNAGSTGEARVGGGAAVAGFISSVGALGNTADLLVVTPDGEGGQHRSMNMRTAATTLLTVMAATASGAAAFSQIAGPGGAAAGTVLGLLGGAVNGGLQVSDAHSTKAKLEQLQTFALACKAAGEQGEDIDDVIGVLVFCLGQQATRKWKGIANATMVGQPLLGAYKAMRGAWKWYSKTKGVDRELASKTLVDIARKGGGRGSAPAIARGIIATVVQRDYDSIIQGAVANAMKSG